MRQNYSNSPEVFFGRRPGRAGLPAYEIGQIASGQKYAGFLKLLDEMGISLSGQRSQVGLLEASCPWPVESTHEAP
jgi:hypothetical protein